MPALKTNLGNSLEILRVNPWALDTDFLATMSTLPHIGSATICGYRVIANSGEITGKVVRGWYGHVAATDGL